MKEYWCGYCRKVQVYETQEEFLVHLDFCESELVRKLVKERSERDCQGVEDGSQ